MIFGICNLQLCILRDMKDLSSNYTLVLVNYSVFFFNLGLQWVLNPQSEETTEIENGSTCLYGQDQVYEEINNWPEGKCATECNTKTYSDVI